MFRNPFNWYNKFGTIPSSYREAMSYEEQILWLCQQITELKEGSANYNYDLLENKPSINGVTLQGNVTASQLGIDFNYNYLTNKPSINNVLLQGNKTLSDLGIQGKLTAGAGISIVGNTISATGGGTGGTSDYENLNNKPSINDVVLLGNSDSRTLGLQNTLWSDETSKIISGKIANLGGYQLNDVVPTKIPTTLMQNTGYIILDNFNGTFIDLYGNYDIYKISEDNTLTTIYTTGGEIDYGYFSSTTNGKVAINFFNLNTYTPILKLNYSGEDITGYLNRIKENYNMLKNDIGRFEYRNFEFENISSFQSGYFDIDKSMIGGARPSAIVEADFSYVKIDIAQKNPMSNFIVQGWADNIPLWFTTKATGGTETIMDCSEKNIDYATNTFIEIDFSNADYIYFQFSHTSSANPQVQLLPITQIEGSSASINHVSTNVILSETPSLSSGFYVIDNGGIYIGNAQASNLAYGVGEIIYYDSSLLTFYGSFKSVYYESNTWNIIENAMLENTLTNSRNKIPTSQAVFKAISNSINFYTPIDGGVYTLNMDGTISYVDSTIPLEAGRYYKLNGTVIQYYQNNELKQATFFNNSLIYVGSGGAGIGYLKAVIFPSVIQLTYEVTYIRDTIGWNASGYSDDNIVQNNTGSYSYVATNIATARSNDVPTVSAVTNYVNNYSTTEKVVGTWVDGRPLYRRVVYGPDTSSASVNIYTVSVPDIEPEEVRSLYGSGLSDAGAHIPLGYIANATAGGSNFYITNFFIGNVRTYNNNREIFYRTGYGLTNFTFLVEYTKSSDLNP